MLKPFLSSSNEDLIIIGSCYLPPLLLAHSRGKLGCLRKAAECLGISEGALGQFHSLTPPPPTFFFLASWALLLASRMQN